MCVCVCVCVCVRERERERERESLTGQNKTLCVKDNTYLNQPYVPDLKQIKKHVKQNNSFLYIHCFLYIYIELTKCIACTVVNIRIGSKKLIKVVIRQ